MMHPSQEKRGKNQAKKPKSDKDTAVPKEKELTYGVESLNLGNPAVESENDSKLLLAQLREVQMANKKYINNSIKRECNVPYNFLNPTKHARTKNSHYSPILKDFMNTRSGRENFKNLQIFLESGISSTIMMGKLTSNLKYKKTSKTVW